MPSFPKWVKEARPETVLGPQERKHKDRFRRLFVDVVRSHARDAVNPSQLELLSCRSIAAAAWRMFAWTEDVEFLEVEVWGRESFHAARRSEYFNQDYRSKMVRLSIGQMRMYQEMLTELRDGVISLGEDDEVAGGNVVVMRRASGGR